MRSFFVLAIASIILPQVAVGNEAPKPDYEWLVERLQDYGLNRPIEWCTPPQAGDMSPIPVAEIVELSTEIPCSTPDEGMKG